MKRNVVCSTDVEARIDLWKLMQIYVLVYAHRSFELFYNSLLENSFRSSNKTSNGSCYSKVFVVMKTDDIKSEQQRIAYSRLSTLKF